GARTVLDDERLTEPFRQPLADQPCNDVDVVARGESDDDVHRPRWIGLRRRNPRHGRKRGSTCSQVKKLSTWEFHFGCHKTRAPRAKVCQTGMFGNTAKQGFLR